MWSNGDARALRWLAAAGLLLVAVGVARQRLATPPAVTDQSAVDAQLNAARRIDLNTADVLALEALPGIGPVTAEAIIGYRRAHGRLTSVDELNDVPGVSPGLVERVRELVHVSEPGGG